MEKVTHNLVEAQEVVGIANVLKEEDDNNEEEEEEEEENDEYSNMHIVRNVLLHVCITHHIT